ncbi:MAG: hypothetical protein GC137_07045 [Alphaproteobacteria bacterium]|nr:hypothetical protein [Alphaproteobacteria bacterium]
MKKKIVDFWKKIKSPRKTRRVANFILIVAFVGALSSSAIVMQPKEAQAICTPCLACLIFDPIGAVIVLDLIQEHIGTPIINETIERHMNTQYRYIVDEFFEDFWVKALAEMTQFLSAFGMFQVNIVGTFFDAQNQAETRLIFTQLQAEAHKDYHPSEDFCAFGTTTLGMAATQTRARLNILAMSRHALHRHLSDGGKASYGGVETDKTARWDRFVNTYCDPKDNGWSGQGSGLDFACDRDAQGPGVPGVDSGPLAADRYRVNRDINYTTLIENPRTLDIDFSDSTGGVTDDEEDVIAMGLNLYGHNTFEQDLSRDNLVNPDLARLHLDLRAVAARRNVAEHSFHSIVGMKAAGDNNYGLAATQPDVSLYMAAVLKDLMPSGTTDAEIFDLLGRNPSYYAQLEVLAKKIYQNPDFFANLYDKPANVKRKAVAMKAISLMLDRALFESELRQEMIMSVLLASKLNNRRDQVNEILQRGKQGR